MVAAAVALGAYRVVAWLVRHLAARGEGLEAGIFISFGASPLVVVIDDELFGPNRVAIAEAKLPDEVKRQGVTTKKKSPAILLFPLKDLNHFDAREAFLKEGIHLSNLRADLSKGIPRLTTEEESGDENQGKDRKGHRS